MLGGTVAEAAEPPMGGSVSPGIIAARSVPGGTVASSVRLDSRTLTYDGSPPASAADWPLARAVRAFAAAVAGGSRSLASGCAEASRSKA